jgi:hypothetical protein
MALPMNIDNLINRGLFRLRVFDLEEISKLSGKKV